MNRYRNTKRFVLISLIVFVLFGGFDVLLCNFRTWQTNTLVHADGNNNCTIPSFGTATHFDTGERSDSVAVADFNLDGNPDLVTEDNNSNVNILLGDGTGSFGTATNFDIPEGVPLSVAVGDFNLDGNPDLVTGNAGISNVSILLGDGTGSFGTATNFYVGFRNYSVAVGDFNLDGNPDLATASREDHRVNVLLGDGTGSFGTATNIVLAGGMPISVVVGDFNLDGNPDLGTANIGSGVSVLLGDGTGSFGTATYFDAGIVTYSVAIGDFNMDGNPDLVTTNAIPLNGGAGGGMVGVLLGDGTGSFGTVTTFGEWVFLPSSVVVSDFNLDGNPDLAASTFDDTIHVLFGDGTGSFGTATNFSVGHSPNSIAVGDFNLDGSPDLATANRGDINSNNVSVLLNNCTANTAPIADAGSDQVTHIGTTVQLDGTQSYDDDGDDITYQWAFVSVPGGSQSLITDPSAMITGFVPDLPGIYVVQLIVNDGFEDSNISTIQVRAITSQTAAIEAVRCTEDVIRSLDSSVFKKNNMQNAFVNKLSAVIGNLEGGNYDDAFGQLQNDILGKANGCLDSGAPDRNDWIRDCVPQGLIYPCLLDAIAKVEELL